MSRNVFSMLGSHASGAWYADKAKQLRVERMEIMIVSDIKRLNLIEKQLRDLANAIVTLTTAVCRASANTSRKIDYFREGGKIVVKDYPDPPFHPGGVWSHFDVREEVLPAVSKRNRHAEHFPVRVERIVGEGEE